MHDNPPIWVRNARVLTMAGRPVPRRSGDLAHLGVIDQCDVLIENGRIADVGRTLRPAHKPIQIDAGGRVLMPAFVDCHTHACWAGERLDEWQLKQGWHSIACCADDERTGCKPVPPTYLEILEAGGGIMSTVRAVRAASQNELADALGERLDRMLLHGTTAAEVKSGYGLDTETELKMLRAIHAAGDRWAGTLVATACIGHAKDPDTTDPVARTINETLPAVHAEFPGVAIDAYCEQGAWSQGETVRLFERARELGHPLRVHADQFNSLGMVGEAVRLGARSVDHLEATTPEDLRLLAGSDTFGVMLPCSGFHVDGKYGDGRAFVDAGGALAIATNWNPGSAPCWSVPMAIALAVRNLGLTPAEAIAASTVNAAAVLGFDDRGVIAAGARADLVLLDLRDERDLGYHFGGNPVRSTICAGRVV